MTDTTTSKSSTRRRYSPEEKAQAVRLVQQLREELGTTQGTVARIAGQLGCGTESVRLWVLCRRRHKTHLAFRTSRSAFGPPPLCGHDRVDGDGLEPFHEVA